MSDNFELKAVIALVIAVALYAAAMHGLNQQIEDAGFATATSKTQQIQKQTQIDSAIAELQQILNTFSSPRLGPAGWENP